MIYINARPKHQISGILLFCNFILQIFLQPNLLQCRNAGFFPAVSRELNHTIYDKLESDPELSSITL